jgi:hypothetical protein
MPSIASTAAFARALLVRYAPRPMSRRIQALFRAYLAAQWGSGAWPAAPLVMHGSAAAVLCGLVAGLLPAYAYALVALSASAALISLPLLGEFGPLLRNDPAAGWVEALPVRRSEIRIARTLLLLVSIAALALAALLPAAWFAPQEVTLGGRLALIAAGFVQALFLAAALLLVQSALGERAEPLLVLVQTLLIGGVVLGFASGLRHVPALAGVTSPAHGSPWLALFPPAWFAVVLAAREGTSTAWSSAPWIATAVAALVLAIAPLPPATRARRSGGVLALLLSPARALATRIWVRARERAVFDLVYDALPLEREFVLRSYPMIGIPLAFLVAGASGEPGRTRDGLLAVLLFTPATYLPILLVHVPASASAAARWLLDTAPVGEAEIAAGARKAVAVRFLVPLYVLLFLLTWSQAGLGFALRLALPGALLSLLLLRRLYALCVEGPPLSVPADEVTAKLDWTGTLLMLAIGLTVVAVLAFTYVTTIAQGLAVSALLVAVEALLEWRDAHSERGGAQTAPGIE